MNLSGKAIAILAAGAEDPKRTSGYTGQPGAAVRNVAYAY